MKPGHDPAAGFRTFLLHMRPLPAGVVCSFYGYHIGSAPMVYQIWRPLGGDNYHLVGEVPYQAWKPGSYKVRLRS